jgi:hypothetical protein
LTIARKTRLLVAGVGLVTLWPLVHLGLCARYDVSPWKLAGWGMYATPRPRTLGMEVHGRPGDAAPFAQLTAPAPALQRAGADFLERWRGLGRLARRDGVAAAVFAAQPAWTELRIEVYRSHLDAGTGMVGLRRDDRHYRRTGGGPVEIPPPTSP